jgi:hypothetical protein
MRGSIVFPHRDIRDIKLMSEEEKEALIEAMLNDLPPPYWQVKLKEIKEGIHNSIRKRGLLGTIRCAWHSWLANRDSKKAHRGNTRSVEYMEGYEPPFPWESEEWSPGADRMEDWHFISVPSPDGNGTRFEWRRRNEPQ